jgi:hypothetical protein
MLDNSDRVPIDKFSLYQWVSTIPLCDDLFLSMQAQNVALVDLMVIRGMEAQLLQAYYDNDDRMPIDVGMLVGATSQMWIYYLYEFMRTWRQRAQELITASEEHERQVTAEKKAETRAKQKAALEKRRKHIRLTPNFHGEHLKRIDDPEFIASIRAYRDKTEVMFRRLEGVRITIAKHEIPKTGKYQMIAEHPGYTRFDTVFTGSTYWQFTLKDDTIDVVHRRDIANEFLRITEEPEREEVLPTKAGPKKTQSTPRRKSRRKVGPADRGKDF